MNLGRKFIVVLGAGVFCSAVSALAAILEWWSLALVALALAVVPVLAALALLRRDLIRLRSGGPVPAPANAAVTVAAADPAAREARLAQQLEASVDRVANAALAESRRTVAEFAGAISNQVSALLWLHAQHAPPAAPPLDLPGMMPQQFAGLLRALSDRKAQRVLVIGAGESGLWVAHSVAQGGGHTDLVTASDQESERLQSAWARIQASSAEAKVPGSAAVHLAPVAIPKAPHAYLDWYDLTVLPEARDYDHVIVAARDTQALRPALPALPLFERLLADDGVVVTIECSELRPLAMAWAAASGWVETSSGLAMGTLRRLS